MAGYKLRLRVLLLQSVLLPAVTAELGVIVKTPQYPVNGSLGQSVWLPVEIDPIPEEAEITWKFTGTVPPTSIARFDVSENRAKIFRGTPFHGRVKMHENFTLQVDRLMEQDQGIYTVTVTAEGDLERSVNLLVYEPVSTPKVEITNITVGEQCNVTLICSAGSADPLVRSWTEMEDVARDPDFQQISGNGTTLELSVKLSANIDYRCTIWNPISEESTKSIVPDPCQRQNSDSPTVNNRSNLLYIIIPVVIAVVIAVAIGRKLYMRYHSSEHIQEHQDMADPNNYTNDERQEQPESTTIYATVQRPCAT